MTDHISELNFAYFIFMQYIQNYVENERHSNNNASHV